LDTTFVQRAPKEGGYGVERLSIADFIELIRSAFSLPDPLKVLFLLMITLLGII
jgi:hypothetical protein